MTVRTRGEGTEHIEEIPRGGIVVRPDDVLVGALDPSVGATPVVVGSLAVMGQINDVPAGRSLRWADRLLDST